MSLYLRKQRSQLNPPARGGLPPVAQRIGGGAPPAEVPYANRRFAISHDRWQGENYWLGLIADRAEYVRSVSVAGWEGLNPRTKERIERGAAAAGKAARLASLNKAARKAAREALTRAALDEPAGLVEFGRADGVGFAVAYPPTAAVVWYSVSAPETTLAELGAAALAYGILRDTAHASTYVSGVGTGAGEKPPKRYDSLPVPQLADHRPRESAPKDAPARVRATGPVRRTQAGVRRTDGEKGPAAPERLTLTNGKAPGRAAVPEPRYGPF